MNKENMLKVADAIERESAVTGRLDMHNWLVLSDELEYTTAGDFLEEKNWCGTSACIGGTASMLEMRETLVDEADRDPGVLNRYMYSVKKSFLEDNRYDIEGKAARYLGLTPYEAHDLFYAGKFRAKFVEDEASGITGIGDAFSYINDHKHLVPDALRWMAQTGEVDWEKGLAVAECRAKQGEPA